MSKFIDIETPAYEDYEDSSVGHSTIPQKKKKSQMRKKRGKKKMKSS